MKNIRIEYRQLFNYFCAMIAIMTLLVMLAYFAFAGEPPERKPVDEWVEENYESLPESIQKVVPKPESTQTEGEWYGRVQQLHDLHGVKMWLAEIKIKPHDLDFPLTSTTNHVAQDSLMTIVAVRGVSVPHGDSKWDRPHVEVELERRRFDEAITYVWKMLSASEYFIVKNPEWVDDICMIDVYIDIAGQRINFADALIYQGHATRTPATDWGKRNLR